MNCFHKNKLAPLLVMVSILIGVGAISCTTAPAVTEEAISEYQRPGARSSNYYDGPHLIYENEQVKILTGVEMNGRMTLETSQYKRSDLTTISVYKSGFLPRIFDVNLKHEIKQQATHYPAAETIFAVSDIEGNFNTLINLLQQHSIINDELNWTFGAGHLVVIGDIFDRGNHVTEMLWFLYRLENQATADKGHVHILLGNHEALNLRGDLRYLEPKYTEFARLSEAQHGINYVTLFGPDSELGRWLRSKNVVEKIGDKLFVHAGFSPAMVTSGYSLEEINERSLKMLDIPKSDFTKSDSLMWGKKGPFWYRGYFDLDEDRWGPHATQTDVDKALEHFAASHVIVGHTHVEKTELRYNGRVCAINVVHPADHLVNIPPLRSSGILIKDDQFFAANEDGQVLELVK